MYSFNWLNYDDVCVGHTCKAGVGHLYDGKGQTDVGSIVSVILWIKPRQISFSVNIIYDVIKWIRFKKSLCVLAKAIN